MLCMSQLCTGVLMLSVNQLGPGTRVHVYHGTMVVMSQLSVGRVHRTNVRTRVRIEYSSTYQCWYEYHGTRVQYRCTKHTWFSVHMYVCPFPIRKLWHNIISTYNVYQYGHTIGTRVRTRVWHTYSEYHGTGIYAMVLNIAIWHTTLVAILASIEYDKLSYHIAY